MHQAVCGCGKNPDNKWFVYSDAPKDGRCRTFLVCPGCGSGPWEGWTFWDGHWEGREAAGAEPVEGAEGGLPQGLHEGVHARLPGAEEIRVRRRGRPRLGEPWVEAGVSRRTWYRRKSTSSS